MIAKCIDIRYTQGDYEIAPSHSKKNPGLYSARFNRGWSDRGTGWMERVTPSKLILDVEIDGERREIWIDHFFKRNFGRLIKKRRDDIRAAMPTEVEVESKVSARGTAYYVVPDRVLETWLAAIP
jgi:hypothetical protein